MRYGFVEEAQRVADGLLDAADAFGGRLPELFCGFDRERRTPRRCPTRRRARRRRGRPPRRCMLLRTLLRFDPWVPHGRVVAGPGLPPGFPDFTLDNLPLAGSRLALRVTDGTGRRTSTGCRTAPRSRPSRGRSASAMHRTADCRVAAQPRVTAGRTAMPDFAHAHRARGPAVLRDPTHRLRRHRGGRRPARGRPGGPRARRHTDRRRDRARRPCIATFDEPQWPRLGRAEPELLHAARVAGHLRDLQPDVVHDHSAVGSGLRRGTQFPRVVTSHGPADGDWGDYLAAAGPGGPLGGDLAGADPTSLRICPGAPWSTTLWTSRPCPATRTRRTTSSGWGGCRPDKAAHLAIDVARKAGRRHRAGRQVQRTRRDGRTSTRGSRHVSGRPWSTSTSWTGRRSTTLLGGAAGIPLPTRSGRSRSAWC